MIIGLISKNKMPFVDGTLPRPGANSPNIKAWDRCNNMVLGWLITACDPLNAKLIMYYRIAREIWLDLQDRFG